MQYKISHSNVLYSTANFAEGAVCSWKSPKLVLSSKLVVNAVPRVGLCMRFKTERDFLGEQVVENYALSATVDEGEPPLCAIIRCGFCNKSLTGTNK